MEASFQHFCANAGSPFFLPWLRFCLQAPATCWPGLIADYGQVCRPRGASIGVWMHGRGRGEAGPADRGGSARSGCGGVPVSTTISAKN